MLYTAPRILTHEASDHEPTPNKAWNSLEIVKLVVAVLTPVSVVVIGYWVNKIAKRFEGLQWINQRIVEKRIEIYDDVAPIFNDLLCFFTFIGGWKELTAPAVITMKRVLDRKVHVAAHLFSPQFLRSYTEFIDTMRRPKRTRVCSSV